MSAYMLGFIRENIFPAPRRRKSTDSAERAEIRPPIRPDSLARPLPIRTLLLGGRRSGLLRIVARYFCRHVPSDSGGKIVASRIVL